MSGSWLSRPRSFWRVLAGSGSSGKRAAATLVLRVTNDLAIPQTLGTCGAMLPPAAVDVVVSWAGPCLTRQRPDVAKAELREAVAAAAADSFELCLEYKVAGVHRGF